MDFPGGSVVEHLPANAGDTGSNPHPLKQLSHNNWACTLEPWNSKYWAHMRQLLKLERML